jgi:hypothetical protein
MTPTGPTDSARAEIGCQFVHVQATATCNSSPCTLLRRWNDGTAAGIAARAPPLQYRDHHCCASGYSCSLLKLGLALPRGDCAVFKIGNDCSAAIAVRPLRRSTAAARRRAGTIFARSGSARLRAKSVGEGTAFQVPGPFLVVLVATHGDPHS